MGAVKKVNNISADVESALKKLQTPFPLGLITAGAAATAPMYGLMGTSKALALSNKRRSRLISHYGLDHDANLPARNYGRGVAGGLAGGIAGGMGAAGLSRLPIVPWWAVGPTVAAGTIGGSLVGAHFATNKYSKKNKV